MRSKTLSTAALLRERIKHIGLTKDDLAKQVSFTFSFSVCKIIKGITPFPPKYILPAAKVLGVSTEEIIKRLCYDYQMSLRDELSKQKEEEQIEKHI